MFVEADVRCGSKTAPEERQLLARPASIRTHQQKLGAPRDKKKKAGGHYAADLILQLPSREVRFRCLHSVVLDW